MRCALLIADLEGVAGVDALEDLVAQSPGYAAACERLTAELNAAIEGLLAAGFDRVRVSDTHQSGSGAPNVLAAALHPKAELRFEENPYSVELFDGVEAVACVGMHAAAGTGGFGAHTVDPLGAWRCGERRISETELVLALAHEAGLGCLFVSGDDVLGAALTGARPAEHQGPPLPERSQSSDRDGAHDRAAAPVRYVGTERALSPEWSESSDRDGALDAPVRYVGTKRALSPARSESRDRAEVLDSLRRAAREPPRPAPPAPDGEWTITFRSVRQTELAARAGAERLDRYRVRLDGATVRERVDLGLRAAGAASAVLADVLPGTPGDACFTEVAAGLLAGPSAPGDWPSTELRSGALSDPPGATPGAGELAVGVSAARAGSHGAGAQARWSEAAGRAPLPRVEGAAIERRNRSARLQLTAAARRALTAFLDDTRDADARTVALRALALHMLEGHAPRVFGELELAPVLASAVDALAALPAEFPSGLSYDDAVARADALYVRRERGLSHPAPEPASLRRCLAGLDEAGYGVHAWMIGELATACGVDARLAVQDRPLRRRSRVVDLYWLTHLILFDTRYLARPPSSGKLSGWIEELLAGAPWALWAGHFDLAAELAFCLQAAGEAESPTHALLLHALLARQTAEGRVGDEGPAGEDPAEVAHTTAAALIALAGAAERR